MARFSNPTRKVIIQPKTTNGNSKARLELQDKTLQGYLVAKDAVSNLIDLIETSSMMALLAIKDCERDLDRLERQIDEEIARAITRVNEATARELLACLKSITDLERIGDLVSWVAIRLRDLPERLSKKDKQHLREMAVTVQDMLNQVHDGLLKRDPAVVDSVFHADRRINQVYHSLFRHHFQSADPERWEESTNVLLMAQALERAGDHVKNLAEELFHLIEHHTLRHPPKRKTYS
jgi:phosphate transport system protein